MINYVYTNHVICRGYSWIMKSNPILDIIYQANNIVSCIEIQGPNQKVHMDFMSVKVYTDTPLCMEN